MEPLRDRSSIKYANVQRCIEIYNRNNKTKKYIGHEFSKIPEWESGSFANHLAFFNIDLVKLLLIGSH